MVLKICHVKTTQYPNLGSVVFPMRCHEKEIRSQKKTRCFQRVSCIRFMWPVLLCGNDAFVTSFGFTASSSFISRTNA